MEIIQYAKPTILSYDPTPLHIVQNHAQSCTTKNKRINCLSTQEAPEWLQMNVENMQSTLLRYEHYQTQDDKLQ